MGGVSTTSNVAEAGRTTRARTRRGGRADDDVGGGVISLLDDDDDDDDNGVNNDDDDDVVIISEELADVASSSSFTRRRRREGREKFGNDTVDDDDKEGGGDGRMERSMTSSCSSRFVPFHLYETTTISSGRMRRRCGGNDYASTSPAIAAGSDVTGRYFRTLRQMIGFDDECRHRCVRGGRRYHYLFVFNYLVDISYLLEKLSPEIYDFRRVVIFYGICGSSDDDNDATDIMNGWKRALIGSDDAVEFVRVVPMDIRRIRIRIRILCVRR